MRSVQRLTAAERTVSCTEGDGGDLSEHERRLYGELTPANIVALIDYVAELERGHS